MPPEVIKGRDAAALFHPEHARYPYGIGGVIVPMFTPVRYENSKLIIDVQRDAALVRRLIANGADTLFILGNAGKFSELNWEQKITHINTVMDTVSKSRRKIPVVVGVSSQDIKESCDLAKYSEEHGATGIVYMPLFGDGDPAEKTRKVLANTKSIPLIFYNNPDIQAGGQSISVDFVRQFTENPRVIGIKNSTRDMETYIQMVQKLASSTFKVFMGWAPNILQAVQLRRSGKIREFSGCVPVQANYNPGIFSNLLKMDGSVKDEQMEDFMKTYYHTEDVVKRMVADKHLDQATADMFKKKTEPDKFMMVVFAGT